MRIGVFSRLRSRLFCFIPERLTVQTEKFPGDDELAEAATSFESGIEGSEIRNRGGKKDAAGLHRHLAWMRALCEVDRKFLASLDLRSVTDALLETVAGLFPGSAATVWLLDTTTSRLEAVACRNLEKPEWQPTRGKGSLDFAMEVVEKKRPSIITNVGAHSRREDIEFVREHRLAVSLGIPMLSRNEIIGVLTLYSPVPRYFSGHEVEFLVTLANQAAVAVQNAQLYQRSLEQSAELSRANISLEKSNRTNADLLSVMSHEFRTPLNLIMGYAGMLNEGCLGEISEEQHKALERILTSSDDLLALVIRLLQAAGIEANTVQLNCEEVVLSNLLVQLKANLRLPCEKKLELVWDYPLDLPKVVTDGEKLKYVLCNLIENAVKFTDRGQIKVSSRALPEDKKVEFEIRDTGVGIPSEALPAVFEKFHQLDSSVTRPYAGLGLGLYVAKKFTELLGGELSVTTEVGKGSIFTVALPVA
jgi:signal transduction histidine kinase